MYLQPQEGELYSVGRCWKARSFKLALIISCIVFIAVIVVVTVIFLTTLIGEFCSPISGHCLSQDSLLLASSPGPTQILSHSRGEKLGEGLGSKLHHGPEMVDSVST